MNGQIRKGFWALTDQGAVSLGNFATQIILARSLSRSNYGIFTLLFGILLVFFTCQGGLITYPLSLKGAVVDRPELRKLAFASLILTLLLAVPLSPILFGTVFVLHVTSLFWIILLAMLLWQIQETLRRALMAHLRYRDAVWGDSISYLGQAAVLWVLAHKGAVTLERTFLVLALTSAAAACLQLVQLGLTLMPVQEIVRLTRRYWSVGRWALLTGISEAGVRQAFPWALALVYGPGEAASFQAVMNVLGVSHPVLFSTNNLIVPAAAGANKEGGVHGAWRSSLHYGLIGLAILVPYFLMLMIWPHTFLSLFYSRFSPYATFSTGLQLAVMSYLFSYCAMVLAAFLYSLGRSKQAFAASFGGATLALVPSAIFIAYYGVTGAIAGILALAVSRLLLNAFAAKQTFGEGTLSQNGGGNSSSASPSALAAKSGIASGCNEG